MVVSQPHCDDTGTLHYVYRDLVQQPAQHRTAGELIPLTLCASIKRMWESIYAQKIH